MRRRSAPWLTFVPSKGRESRPRPCPCMSRRSSTANPASRKAATLVARWMKRPLVTARRGGAGTHRGAPDEAPRYARAAAESRNLSRSAAAASPKAGCRFSGRGRGRLKPGWRLPVHRTRRVPVTPGPGGWMLFSRIAGAAGRMPANVTARSGGAVTQSILQRSCAEPGAWMAFSRPWQQREAAHVTRLYHAEMPQVERCDFGELVPFGGCDDRGVDRPERQVVVPRYEFGHPQGICGVDGLEHEVGREVAEESHLGLPGQASADQVGHLADDERRDEQRAWVGFQQFQAGGVVPVVGVYVGVQRAGVDDQGDGCISRTTRPSRRRHSGEDKLAERGFAPQARVSRLRSKRGFAPQARVSWLRSRTHRAWCAKSARERGRTPRCAGHRLCGDYLLDPLGDVADAAVPGCGGAQASPSSPAEMGFERGARDLGDRDALPLGLLP